MSYKIVIGADGVIEPQPLNPDEKFVDEENTTTISATVGDFWQWAYSDLVSNTDRGILAEYIVAIALGIDDTVRVPWGPYDLRTSTGTKVEVKSGSYIQSWNQSEHSKIQFSIKKTLEWIPDTNSFGGDRKRQADMYVFCHLSHPTKEDINPLNLGQWDFYVIPTVTLDTEMKDAGSISLARVKKYSEKYSFRELKSVCEESN
tara:strand:- start:8 stop:616 length:609 start_codon:yes stop_codon:yes gene_type:complete